MKIINFLLAVTAMANVAFAQIDGAPRGIETLSIDAPLNLEAVTPETLRAGEPPIPKGHKRVIAHARPVAYIGDDGARRAIETALEPATEATKSGFNAYQNTVKFRVTEDGVCIYRSGEHVLRIKPAKAASEAAGGATIASEEQVKPIETTVDDGRVVQRGSFSDIRFEHIVLPGEIKEVAWVDAKPIGLDASRIWIMLYQFQSPTLVPVISGGEVLWQAGGKTVLRWPVPVVADATGKEIAAQYRLRPSQGLVGIAMQSADMALATYPVGIDPTTTTDLAASTASRSRASNAIVSSLREFESCYMLITLPDMTGKTVTGAEWQVYSSSVMTPLTLDAYVCKNATTWTSASSLATMNTVRTGMGTAVVTGITSVSAIGWNYIDVLGDPTKGVAKIYTDNPNPGACTFSFRWPASARSITSTQTALTCGDEDAGPLAKFASYSGGTYPRVVITYTTASSAWSHILISEE